LISNLENRYVLSAAAIRRARQLALAGDDEVDENKGKVVSISIKQILTKKVKYQLER
jgi:DNA-directed RNA polymerase subunit omega